MITTYFSVQKDYREVAFALTEEEADALCDVGCTVMERRYIAVYPTYDPSTYAMMANQRISETIDLRHTKKNRGAKRHITNVIGLCWSDLQRTEFVGGNRWEMQISMYNTFADKYDYSEVPVHYVTEMEHFAGIKSPAPMRADCSSDLEFQVKLMEWRLENE